MWLKNYQNFNWHSKKPRLLQKGQIKKLTNSAIIQVTFTLL